MLEMERNKRRSDGNKSSLQLVRTIQEKINNIADSLHNEGEKSDFSSEPLFDYFRTLTQKQKNLMKTPFLEKIDLKQRKSDADLFVESGQLMKQRMLDLMQQWSLITAIMLTKSRSRVGPLIVEHQRPIEGVILQVTC